MKRLTGSIRAFLHILLPVAAAWAAARLFVRRVWVYRDPVRITPANEALLISPCDGQVVYIRRVEQGQVAAQKPGEYVAVAELTHAEWPGGEAPGSGWLIGIYVSTLDVQFQYAPISAQVVDMAHTQARNNLPIAGLWERLQLTYLRRAVDLFGRRYALENERQTVVLDGTLAAEALQVALVQIADRSAGTEGDAMTHRDSSYVRAGEEVRRGQKLGFAGRGSQVNLFVFAEDIEILVGVGDQVYGAQTPLAERLRLSGS